MRRRKKTNSCLLALLKMVVISSFVLLMGCYGIYKFFTTPIQLVIPDSMVQANNEEVEGSGAEEEPTVESVVPDTTHHIQIVDETYGNEQAHESIPVEWVADNISLEQQVIETSAEEEVELEIGDGVVQDIEQHEVAETQIDRVVDEQIEVPLAIQEENISDSAAQEVADQEQIESVQLQEDSQSDEVEDLSWDIPVYNSYELKLTDEVLAEAEKIMADGEINLAELIGKYFAGMTTSEKVSLLGMLASKIPTIDIDGVWEMVADGLTAEDVAILQQLIEDTFTEEEIDTLYVYYTKSELAQVVD